MVQITAIAGAAASSKTANTRPIAKRAMYGPPRDLVTKIRLAPRDDPERHLDIQLYREKDVRRIRRHGSGGQGDGRPLGLRGAGRRRYSNPAQAHPAARGGLSQGRCYGHDRADGQRAGPRRGRGTQDAAGGAAARAAAAHRHPRGLRHQPVRRLHGLGRRQVGQELHHAGGGSRGRGGDHDRGPRPRHRMAPRTPRAPCTASDAGGLQRLPRPAVRVLHPGNGDERRRAGAAAPGPFRGRGPALARGQSLPLHRLPQHRPGGARGGRGPPRRRPLCPGRPGSPAMPAGNGSAGSAVTAGSAEGIGAAVTRREDRRFLLGKGRYTDDIQLPEQSWAVFVRSPHAHAAIRSIDAARALAAPGVLAVLTGDDVAADGLGGIPCGWQIKNKDGSNMVEPPHPALAQGQGRHAGDPVAMVVADTRAQAREAAKLVDVDYQPLPAVAHLRAAAGNATDAADTAGASAQPLALVWDEAPGNVCFDWHLGDAAAVDAAFATADRVVAIDVVNNRVVPNAIEPRAANGHYDPVDDRYTLYTTSQNPHLTRLLLAAFTLKVPEHKLRVVAPDVGGGFGSKIFHYAEELLVLWASRRVGRPVKWTAERSESFLSDAHGRDHLSHAELALDADGRFLALRVRTLANLGAYLSTFAPAIPTYLYATLLSGPYAIPAIYAEVKALFTHTVPVDAVRGAGRPEASYLLERLVDKAARELGADRVELRRRNFIRPDQFPYQTAVALQYDTGDYGATLHMALAAIDYQGLAERKAAP